jgi:hypothetical protein
MCVPCDDNLQRYTRYLNTKSYEIHPNLEGELVHMNCVACRAGHHRSCFQSLGALALPRRISTPNKKLPFQFDEDNGSTYDLSPNTFPFPRTSPLHSPSFTRTPTVSKPLKPSLRSSNSSPLVPSM